MELLRIAGATLNQTPLDWQGNAERIRRLLIAAREKSVDVVCFPELCISGYNCEDMFFSLYTARKAEEVLLALLPEVKGFTAILGLPIFHQGAMYNAVAVVQNGRILGVNPKKVLPREGVHYESRWFQPASFNLVDRTNLAGMELPFGDFRYQLGSLGMAIEICEEAWRSDTSAGDHAAAGVELILNPSASHFALDKVQSRETMVANNSRSMRVHYLYTNLLGLESGRIIYDGGVLIAECGKITTRGERFGFHDGALTIKDIDLDLARVAKLRERAELQGKPANGDSLVIRGDNQVHRNLTRAAYENIDRIHFHSMSGCWRLTPEEEFLAAEMIGLFDYLRKSAAKGYLVSLSGGCDSSATALLVAQMIACALKELGPTALAARLSSAVPEKDPTLAESWVNKLLTCLYQSTENSSGTTLIAADSVARELGADFHIIELQDIVEAYEERARDSIRRQLTWQEDDLARQNIQARSRAPMAWLLANLKGAILLATSNRSEVALGYATMDGDTAGGLAPLGGIGKSFLQAWLRWAQSDCRWGLGSIKSLQKVNEQAPTAELRPKKSAQKDEEDLMPYPMLARIEQLFLRDRMAPAEILPLIIDDFPQYGVEVCGQFLQRFFRLWSVNQWKRERYAPAFHLDDVSLDPKTWCRFPILSGGFDEVNASLIKRH